MHKREILRLYGLVKKDGYALIPLSVYLKRSHVKVSIGLCKGKKLHDKRESIARRDAQREIDDGEAELADALTELDVYKRQWCPQRPDSGCQPSR